MAQKKAIKFFATWCGPCKVYGKTWEKVVNKFQDEIEFIDVDIEKDTTGLAAQYKISTVPTTVLVLANGSTESKSGRLNQTELEEFLNQ